MNGNVVLVPAAVVAEVGTIDTKFTQQIGDFDYGLRATRRGAKVWISAGFVGTCKPNTKETKWQSARYSLNERIAYMNSPLGLRFAEYMTFAYRHGGLRGALFTLWGYRRLFFPVRRPASQVKTGEG
jgi:GT2 family glycosyltransferase